MTDRVKGCWVAFEQDYREDDIETLISAIRQLRGVYDVEPRKVQPDDWINLATIRREMQSKIAKILYDKKAGSG